MPDTGTVLTSASKLNERLAAETDKHLIRMRKSIKNLQERMRLQLKALETDKTGRLVGPRVNLKQAQQIHKDLLKVFDEEYGEVMRRGLSKSFDEVAKAIQDNFKDLDVSMQYTKLDRDMIATLKNSTYEDFATYGQQAQDQMSTAMYDQIAARAPWTDLVSTMDAILIGGVDKRGQSMAQYSELWANEAIMNFQQQVHLKKAEDAGLEHFLYFGNIMERSRPFCIDRAGKVFSREQIESWNELSWQGKSGPPMVKRGGWNCRHHWQAVDPDWLPDGPLDIGDFFKEEGITIPRGTTLPAWPGPGGVGKKVIPKPPPRPPIKFGNPQERWVPQDVLHADAQLWADNLYAHSKAYRDWSGLNPSGPVADNIAEVLQAQGRNGRVMMCQYMPKGATSADEAFMHFVAVELDDAGKVFRIYDPTNEFIEVFRLEELVPGARVPEYWPKLGDAARMEPQIFKKGQWARDTGDLYTMDDHAFFYDKMKNPADMRAALGKPTPPPPPPPVAPTKGAVSTVVNVEHTEEVAAAGSVKQPVVGFKEWKPAKTLQEAKAQMKDIIEECNRRDIYARVQWGTDKDAYAVRYWHSEKWTRKDDRFKDAFWKSDKLHNKIGIAKKTTLNELNAVNKKLAELQARSSVLEIPPLRGAFTWGRKAGWAANMGDGSMGIHIDSFSGWFGGLEFDEAKYAANLTKAVAQREALLSTVAELEGKTSQAYRAIKEQLDLYKNELKMIEEGTWAGPTYGPTGRATKWRPGDSTASRPENVRDYFTSQADRGYKTMEHEYGHHIHQQLFVDGDPKLLEDPPVERWCYYFMRQNPATKDHIYQMTASRYGLSAGNSGKVGKEWFAENYSCWKMGKKHLVNEELWGVMEGLDDLESGKITYNQLKNLMFEGGDFARPIIPKAVGVYKEAMEYEVDELYYKVVQAMKTQEGATSIWDLNSRISADYGDMVWSSDIEDALTKAAKSGLVDKVEGGNWVWKDAKPLSSLPTTYTVPATLRLPPAPQFKQAVLDLWDTIVGRTLTLNEVTTLEDLMAATGVDTHVARIFLSDAKAAGLLEESAPGKYLVKDAAAFKR